MTFGFSQLCACSDRCQLRRWFCWLVVLLTTSGAGSVFADESARVDFNFQIRPLLSDRCFRCHGPDSATRKAKLRLDTHDGTFKELDDGWAVVKPGEPTRSELVRRIFTEDEDDHMPPPDSHLKLSVAEKELLKRWVAEGAEYKSHWSLIPVGQLTPPQPQNTRWIHNPIDSFVLARLEKENLVPAPQASRETLIRRLAFDLTGLPPTLAEIDAFLADQSRDTYEKAVVHYLNSPAYGERMALDWLDLARFADTYGYQADVDCNLSPWRDWVIKAFNENLPYDQFLTWQLAGDLLPNATRDQRLATAFNRLHRQTNEGGSIEEEFRTEYASDRVNTVSTAMLGLTMQCARCHDHKFDPIKQRDYYSFSAFFNSIDESGLYSHFTRATPTPTMLLWPEDKSAEAAALKAQIAAVEAKLRHTVADGEKEFPAWLASDGKVAEPQPIAHFTFDTVTTNTTPDSVNPANLAQLVDGPIHVPGAPASRRRVPETPAVQSAGGMPTLPANFALQFSGDNEVICETVSNFKRTEPFSFSLWLKPAVTSDRAVILHQSRAWTDSGSRGLELVLEHGKPFFGLIHFWPGNAIAVRARQALPTNEWSHVTVTYDGSSRAAGIQLYLNGARLETDVVRDHLYKDIIHRSQWGDAEVGNIHLQLAGRFRDHGFKDGAIDDLQVFNLALAEPEVKLIAGGKSPAVSLDYFLARHYEPYLAALVELQTVREQQNDLVNDIPEIMVMEEMAQPRPTHRLNRGAYDAPGELVARDTPGAILPFPKNQPRDRLGLARWMTERQNPLTARVVVNRIWAMHFGRGLVATPEDFGSQGSLPTHPQLLDWLAGWFMDNGWNVKALHQLIVNSATYQQSSRASRELVARDPGNALLARGQKHRLLAEEIRDGALAASGLLNHTVGGPSVKPYQPAGLWEQSGTGKTYTQDHGDKLYRRSLYTFWRRTSPPPSMLTFDAVTREVCTAKRETTATPLQSLVLLNDPQFIEAARVLSEKLLKQFPNDEAARNRDAFRSLTGRSPDVTEAKILAQLFAEQTAVFAKDPDGAKKLLAVGESKRDETLPPAEFAAMTALVNAIMNFDEFVVER
jgi:Protein of unknown function (DUF1553)/Protein of unknown function (DUF1549)/Concanavalin A-like lectin/glucanases superfamily/Planctomycete cytochrome C